MKHFKNKELNYVNKDMHYYDVDFGQNDIVSAQYIKVAGYEGNPDICALPLPAVGKSALDKGTYYPEILFNPDADPSLRADSMRQIRLPMKNQGVINQKIYNGTVLSYAGRIYSETERPIKIDMSGEEIELRIQSDAYVNHTTLGSAIIGLPGTGKSTAISIALKDWPRVICHDDGKGGHYVQIPIIRTTAFGCSNLSALFQAFAKEIDVFLDTGTMHFDMITKKRTIGAMSEQIIDWIKRYHIGTWIIEEISFFDFDSSRNNSFENIVTIIEMTGVFLFATGNDEIFSKISKNLRIKRRLMSNYINMNEVANDKHFLKFVVERMWNMMICGMNEELTNKIFDMVYTVTHGSIDLISILLVCIQQKYIYDQKIMEKSKQKYKVRIDEKYVKKVADEKIKHMSKLFLEGQTKSVERYKEFRDRFDMTLSTDAVDETSAVIAQMKADIEAGYDHYEKLRMVQEAITDLYDQYTPKMIESAFSYVEKREDGFRRKTDKDMKRLVLKRLQDLEKQKKRKKDSTVKKTSDHMEKDYEKMCKLLASKG